MKRDSNRKNTLISSNRRRIAKRAERPSYSIDSLNKKLQDLQANATQGSYQAQIRLEAISQLLDPCLDFCESDVRRILNKGYPPQVQRGLRLFRLMRHLVLLCEPVGDTVGVACRVRLINFEDLTFSKLVDIKGHTAALVARVSDKGMTSERFNGLELLTSEEKNLYERIKRYFGGRKRPTLKSLTLSLLGEEGEVFSDRSASNHLTAVREFCDKHKDKLGLRWFFIGGVDSYNRNAKSARESCSESISSMRNAVRGLIVPDYSKAVAQMVIGINQQILSSEKTIRAMAMSLPKIVAQDELAKLAASSVLGIMRMPSIRLPKIYFEDDAM
jgi:hypothetical protein